MTIERASDNPYPSVLMVEGDPEDLAANPASGQRRLAVGTDHLLYLVDDAGVKTAVGGSTDLDAIIAASSGQDIADALAAAAAPDAGNPFATIADLGGGGSLPSGTSNPGSPADGDLFYRSDLDLLIRYHSSGTRWVCVCPHLAPLQLQTTLIPQAATFSMYAGFDSTAFALLVERLALGTIIPSGTSNSSNYWTLTFAAGTYAPAAVDTKTDGNAPARHDLAGGVVPSGTVYGELTIVKTSAPGSLYTFAGGVVYRYIVT